MSSINQNILLVKNISYSRSILIVDDEIANLNVLINILTTRPYDIRIANNGRRALAAINISLPDLILLDINMPDLNGYQVCQELKTNPISKHIPVIFISANNETLDIVEAFSVGGVDYITKPFRVEEVLARIDSQLKISELTYQLQMQMLRYQLNPHFLFNALNSVRSLIYVDQNSAEKMITQLSDYLHYLLSSKEQLENSLAEELSAAENYLAVEKIRFEEKLQVIFNTNHLDKSILVPSFVLQPLLENAIKYGMRTSTKPLMVEITGIITNSELALSVINSGKWVEDGKSVAQGVSLGVGLNNIKRRLNQLYPSYNSFEINTNNNQVCITIKIPLMKAQKE